MAKDNKTLIYVGGAGIAALLGYEWWKKKQAAATAVTVPVTLATAPDLTTALAAGNSGGTIATSPAAITATLNPLSISMAASNAAGSQVPAGIDPTVYSVVQKWGQTDNRAPVLVMLAANIPSEYNGMYDIIANYWDKNIGVGPTQVKFWNSLRGKYDPGDAIW